MVAEMSWLQFGSNHLKAQSSHRNESKQCTLQMFNQFNIYTGRLLKHWQVHMSMQDFSFTLQVQGGLQGVLTSVIRCDAFSQWDLHYHHVVVHPWG